MAGLAESDLRAVAADLVEAARTGKSTAPLTGRYPGADLADGYRVQRAQRDLRVARGAVVRGYTLAFASAAARRQTPVDRPVLGYLTADQCHPAYAPIPAGRLIRPRVGVGLAFILGRAPTGRVLGPDAVRAVDCVLPALVILDSRTGGQPPGTVDAAADNATLAAVVLGEPRVLAPADLRLAGCLLHRNGALAETGAGGALLGSPIEALARLANEAAQLGWPLEPGHLAVLGSITPTVPVGPGDSVAATVSGLGTVAAVLSADRAGTEGDDD